MRFTIRPEFWAGVKLYRLCLRTMDYNQYNGKVYEVGRVVSLACFIRWRRKPSESNKFARILRRLCESQNQIEKLPVITVSPCDGGVDCHCGITKQKQYWQQYLLAVELQKSWEGVRG